MTSLALLLAATVSTSAPPTRSFWKLEDAPRPQPVQSRVNAELVGEGTHLVVYRENGYRFSTLGEDDETAQVESATRTFDETIYPRLVDLIGPCPDVDGNGKVILLLSRSTSDDITFLGFDQLADGVALRSGLHSNEGEVLYLSFSRQGNQATANLAELAASFARLLMWARDASEVGWADLVGNWAAYACGLAGPRSLWGDGSALLAFPSPGDPLSSSGWSPLLIEYIRERLGDGVVRRLAADPHGGVAGLESALGTLDPPQAFSQLAADFAMACWLDDPGVAGPRFSFPDLTPPRPLLTTRFPASRPSSGQIACGSGGMAHLLVEGDGERPLQLALRGDPAIGWNGRAVHLRRRGPDEELPVAFDDSGLARVDLPLLPTGDAVVIALTAVPPPTPDFDTRRFALLWGLGWVPRPFPDPTVTPLGTLVEKAFGAASATELREIGSALDRMAGLAPAEGATAPLTTRYAWSPAAGETVAALQAEASRRRLSARILPFIRSAQPDIRQEWQDVLLEIPGSDPRRWPVVIAAHWDSARGSLAESYLRALGLEDNGAGVVVALEAARITAAAPLRSPVIVALLAGGDHGGAGAAALLESLKNQCSAWIELDGVGRSLSPSREVEVRVEGAGERDPAGTAVAGALRRVGLSPAVVKEVASPHTGVALAQSRGISAVVVRTRDAEAVAAAAVTPAEVERTQVSRELLALLAQAIGQAAIGLSGVPQ